MKRNDFNSFEEFENSGTAGNYEEVTVIRENGWIKCDLLTECKSWKTALRRFFKMLGNEGIFEGWYECMTESAENGYFKLDDFTMGNGSKNPLPGYCYEIEETSENVWYIFLNLREDTTEENEEETEMKEFAMIEKNVREDHDKRTAETAFYIENGYFSTWAAEHHTDPDRGLKAHSTETRWKQYQTGTISREKAVELATKRAQKYIDKTTAAKLAQLDRVANAPDLTSVSVCVDWVRSRTWGYYPRVEIITNTGTYTGAASGCGYDKESAAIADAFNKCDSILKVLYQLKENGLRAGKTDESKTASCGRSNGDICGYGAGYGAIPYFEGGVGASCFWSILKNCGYKISCHHGQLGDFYSVEKEDA